MRRSVERCSINVKPSMINQFRNASGEAPQKGAQWRIVAFAAAIGAALGLIFSA